MGFEDLNLGYLRDYINNNYNNGKYLITDCEVDYEKQIITVYTNGRLFKVVITIDEYNTYLRKDKLNKLKNKINKKL